MEPYQVNDIILEDFTVCTCREIKELYHISAYIIVDEKQSVFACALKTFVYKTHLCIKIIQIIVISDHKKLVISV